MSDSWGMTVALAEEWFDILNKKDQPRCWGYGHVEVYETIEQTGLIYGARLQAISDDDRIQRDIPGVAAYELPDLISQTYGMIDLNDPIAWYVQVGEGANEIIHAWINQ